MKLAVPRKTGAAENRRHGQKLSAAPPAKLPGDDAGEAYGEAAGKEAEDADAGG